MFVIDSLVYLSTIKINNTISTNMILTVINSLINKPDLINFTDTLKNNDYHNMIQHKSPFLIMIQQKFLHEEFVKTVYLVLGMVTISHANQSINQSISYIKSQNHKINC